MDDKEQYLIYFVIILTIISGLLAIVWPMMILVMILNSMVLGFIFSPIVLIVKIQAAVDVGLVQSPETLDLMIFLSIFIATWMSIPIFRKLTKGMDRRNVIIYLGATQIGNIAIFTYQHTTTVGFLPF